MITTILAIVAFLLLARLFSTFGKYSKISIPPKGNRSYKPLNSSIDIVSELEEKNLINKNITAEKILELQTRVTDFSPLSFLNKTEEMFDSIFNAFANSHHHVLKSMLADSLYEQFAENIKKREEQNLRQEILIKHKKTYINDIQIRHDKTTVLVEFDVAQMSAIIDSSGNSSDNPKRIYRDIIHKWLFSNYYDDKHWILSQTSSIEKGHF
jgi:predicted lipid-binding transport protein (Tim44 family)